MLSTLEWLSPPLWITPHCQNTYIRTRGEEASAEGGEHFINRAGLSHCYARDCSVRKEITSLSVLLVQNKNTLIFCYKQCISSIIDETKYETGNRAHIGTSHKYELSLNTDKEKTLKKCS